jgi:LysM repeat protein
LFSIGRRYGVNPYYIAKVNGLRNPNYIYAGQILYIPAERQSWGGYDRTLWDNRGYRRYPQYQGGYGYDYTGYYYDGNFPEYRRYSYTCGYYYNCY